jgi:hypothetical protein
VPVVAEREVAELQRGGHVEAPQAIAHNTAPQITAITAAATARRCNADIRRIEGAIDAGG